MLGPQIQRLRLEVLSLTADFTTNAKTERVELTMRGSGNEWKVVDVYLVGMISELATRRSEFLAILRSGGPSALIQQLHEQADRSLGGQSPSK